MTVNTNRLQKNITQLELLVSMLKQASNGEISIAEVGRQFGLNAQETSHEMDTCFARYIKKNKMISEEVMSSMIIAKDLPSTRFLKDVFGFSSSEPVVFPAVDEDDFWKIVKQHYSDSYYKVVTMHNGYEVEKPLSFEKIAANMNCSRMRACDIYKRAVNNFDSSILYEVYNYEYTNKKKELEQSEEFETAKKSYETLMFYISKVADIDELNEYIKTNYPEVSELDLSKVNENFSIPVDQLGISNKLLLALTKNNISTLADIYMTPAISFKHMTNFGKIKCTELYEVLSNREDDHPNRAVLLRDLASMTQEN